MAEINFSKKPKTSTAQSIGTGLQMAAPLLAFIPGAGPALAAGASVGGGLLSAAGGGSPSAGGIPTPQKAAPAPQQSAPAAAAPVSQAAPMQRRMDQVAPGQMKQLEDSIVASRSLSPEVQQQTLPVLSSAYDVMKRRIGMA
jgi:hypothetical protein